MRRQAQQAVDNDVAQLFITGIPRRNYFLANQLQSQVDLFKLALILTLQHRQSMSALTVTPQLFTFGDKLNKLSNEVGFTLLLECGEQVIDEVEEGLQLVRRQAEAGYT